MRRQLSGITMELEVPEAEILQSVRSWRGPCDQAAKHIRVRTVTANLSRWIHSPGMDAKGHPDGGTSAGEENGSSQGQREVTRGCDRRKHRVPPVRISLRSYWGHTAGRNGFKAVSWKQQCPSLLWA